MGFFNTGYIAIQRLQPIYSPNPLYFSSKQDTRLLWLPKEIFIKWGFLFFIINIFNIIAIKAIFYLFVNMSYLHNQWHL